MIRYSAETRRMLLGFYQKLKRTDVAANFDMMNREIAAQWGQKHLCTYCNCSAYLMFSRTKPCGHCGDERGLGAVTIDETIFHPYSLRCRK